MQRLLDMSKEGLFEYAGRDQRRRARSSRRAKPPSASTPSAARAAIAR
jgi:hypothetical protein